MKMNDAPHLDFGSATLADDYDRVLVPALFAPWAELIRDDYGPWVDRDVLDVATGTGIVAERLAAVGAHVHGVDINPEMLARAGERCGPRVRLRQGAADALEDADDSYDTVICQQGFQFFPDKSAAAAEFHRVLRPGGRAVVTTWRSTAECEFYGAMCGTLDEVGASFIADAMRVPFDHCWMEDLASAFKSAGFHRIHTARRALPLKLDGGIANAIAFAYANPVGPQIRALPDDVREGYEQRLAARLHALSADGTRMGHMVANELVATV
jgi:ubiquinone/menaquinone biosynthesis C-methylase UbiE